MCSKDELARRASRLPGHCGGSTCDLSRSPTNTPGTQSLESFLEKGLRLDPELFLPPPIHRLPPELLSHIFQFEDVATTTFPTPFAWAAAHVCTRWRHVALETTSLWSTFVLDVTSFPMDTKRLGNMLEFLDTCLTLSKMAPLRFAIFMRSRNASACNTILGRLCLHSRRWRRAFVIASTDVLAPWKHRIRDNTPILESLGVGSLDAETGSADLPRLFGNSAISSLALCHYQLVDPLTSSRTIWPQLTSLRLIACAYNVFPAILSLLPNLRELEIEGVPPRAGVVYVGHLIELPHLATLRITACVYHIHALLPFLSTPSLVDLSMTLYNTCFDSRDPNDGVGFVRDFISRAKKVKAPVVNYVDEYYLDSIQDHIIRFIC